MISFSIVINTLNRGPLLQKTLAALRWLRYDGDFEVVVVNGPSTDDTDSVIASWMPAIRLGKCDVANLSVSRNIGICMAQGDIVVFIDDDAIPEPEWLSQLATAYDSPAIGAAGGLVYDQSGYTFQYRYSTANRLANANWAANESATHLCFPGSFEFPYLQGTNASFRRAALLEIGGFDEELEYYLDETELCCRLVDAGYVIRQLPCAYVHHKFAPSHLRDSQRVIRYRFPVVKNKIYFSLKHGRDYLGLGEILEDDQKFSCMHRQDVQRHIDEGRLPQSELDAFEAENKQAWDVGVARGLEAAVKLIDPKKHESLRGDFSKFSTLANTHSRNIVLISRDFPPNHSGGIATFVKDLAEAVAAQGHIVDVITESHDINRVDLEQGVWVHRILIRETERSPEAVERNVPHAIWNWSSTAREEARRIATHRKIDIVEAPIWDCEGIAFLLDGNWPLVTSLETTLHFWLDSRPEHRQNAAWMASFGTPMLELERALMVEVAAVRASSHAIVRDIEQAYGFEFDKRSTVIIPHGMGIGTQPMSHPSKDCVTLLFVGRLEPRKGIDVLLKAVPDVLAAEPGLHIRILGDDSLPGPDGQTFKEIFLASDAGKRWAANVSFEGRVDDESLRAAYASCDVFVAPSRFESFGLVLLEAMREGKPVVGCIAGGMTEIVMHEVNGLLVPPGDADALAQAILRLLRSPELRRRMGEAGRALFLERFTSARMAEASSVLYQIAVDNFRGGATP
jgi:glycogen(starch) synthase